MFAVPEDETTLHLTHENLAFTLYRDPVTKKREKE